EQQRYRSSLEQLITESQLLEGGGILSLRSVMDSMQSDPFLKDQPTGRKPEESGPRELGLLLLAAIERYHWGLLNYHIIEQNEDAKNAFKDTETVLRNISETRYELNRSELFDLLLFLATIPSRTQMIFVKSIGGLIENVVEEVKHSPLTEGERYVLYLLRKALSLGGTYLNEACYLNPLTELIGDRLQFLLSPGEVWTDQLNEDLAEPSELTSVWRLFLGQCLIATSSRPSSKWIEATEQILGKIGKASFDEGAIKWIRLFERGRSYNIVAELIRRRNPAYGYTAEEHATVLRGILWSITLRPQPDEYARIVTVIALSAFKKVPGIGPRAAKVGNAAVYALSQMGTLESLGQLAILKVRVKSASAQKEIEKAFNTLAEKLELPREEIEELGVPCYGLEEVGLLSETLGEYRAELRVDGSSAQLHWFDAKEKELKSVPAKVKAEHKEELKDLQQSVKDITGMLPAQRERLDGMFLAQKTWTYSIWEERYLNHPLVGTIARRLIWNVGDRSAVFSGGKLVDRHGDEVSAAPETVVSLWHPIDRPVEEITAWRERLETLVITQPFKQAHREIYLLTDAERNTNVYSNRFAAHIIRQHQFNALCAMRGWKNKLRLMVDADYPPAEKLLANWGLRAEYWVEGIGQNYGADTNETGVFLRLTTDQVRFYQIEASENFAHAGGGGYAYRRDGGADVDLNAPIPLEETPPLVFSEIMRDVDLFTGVCSVANDPNWQDGGVVPQFRQYWEQQTFGELSGSSTTRKVVLERLIPRMKIADQCSFADRYLIVKGTKRTYKIHLGSGNILMEPNDQYLCIVPDSRARAAQGDLFLPFEGDNMLSIILSKALLLAEDHKIKDLTIIRQIEQA
ncbi:MAG: DUF4132 domain-containing protein, partial [Planctomycetaceae bacterium]|nr:DUF4132 domain-containing protein [Planctomycetaceae bacterium]